MQRRTAVAAASAISISLVSAVVALGVNFGALGFAASDPSPSNSPVEVAPDSASQTTTAPSGNAGATTDNSPNTGRDRDDERDEAENDDDGSERVDDDRPVFEESEHDD